MQGARITLRVCRGFLLRQAWQAAGQRHSSASYHSFSNGGNNGGAGSSSSNGGSSNGSSSSSIFVALFHVFCAAARHLLLSIATSARRGAAMVSEQCLLRSEARSRKPAVRWSARMIPVFILGVVAFACWALTKPICSKCSYLGQAP